MVDDLHDLAGIDPGQVGQELEAEVGLVVERGDHLRDVTGPDPDLGLVVALPDGPGQLVGEPPLQAGLEGTIHVTPARGPWGRSHAPANGRGDP